MKYFLIAGIVGISAISALINQPPLPKFIDHKILNVSGITIHKNSTATIISDTGKVTIAFNGKARISTSTDSNAVRVIDEIDTLWLHTRNLEIQIQTPEVLRDERQGVIANAKT